jgi:hypothetical protein
MPLDCDLFVVRQRLSGKPVSSAAAEQVGMRHFGIKCACTTVPPRGMIVSGTGGR